MSSKAQLTSYIKGLNKDLEELKDKNVSLSEKNEALELKVDFLTRELEESKKKQRRWYHF